MKSLKIQDIDIVNKAISKEIKEDYPNWDKYAPKEPVVTILRPIQKHKSPSAIQRAFVDFKFGQEKRR
jgi:hypothetical protein